MIEGSLSAEFFCVKYYVYVGVVQIMYNYVGKFVESFLKVCVSLDLP